jgi:hypothetical protein
MKYHKLRIAWSVAWGVVTILFCALWIRSYWTYDVVNCPLTSLMHAGVQSATAHCSIYATEQGRPVTDWQFHSDEITDSDAIQAWLSQVTFFGFGLSFSANTFHIIFPHWAGALAAGISCVAVMPRLRFRFSLRMLLFATSLVAVVLGMIVWLSRAG